MDWIDTSKVEWLFFDLDHTLWDYQRNANETMRELFVHYGPKMSRQVSFERFIRTYHEHNSRLWKRYREDKIDSATLRRLRWEITFRDLGVEVEDWVEQISEDYLQSCPRKPYLMPHTEEVLTALGARFPMHIITNGFLEVQQIKLDASGLTPYFEHMTTPDMVDVKKPNPKIFHHAMQAVGADPARSLHVGDNYEADVLGAKGIGMPVVYYNSRDAHNPDNVPEIRDLRKLAEWLL
ncbi:MAG: YjjG family noncanonical pyrimidine nucleotidase [Bacteroidota bacterium]